MALVRITPQSADRVCVLLVGMAGMGKTSQLRCLRGQDRRPDGSWQSVQQPERVFVLSAESGLLCVRDLVASGQIEGVEIRSLGEFQEALRWCLSPEFRKAGFQWVFIDSLTEIASRCAEDMQRKYPSKVDSFKMWGEYTQQMTEIIKTFRDLSGVSVVFTCLAAVDKDDVGRSRIIPDISGNALKNRLPSYFDEVLFMDRRTFQSGNPDAPQQQETVVFDTRNPIGVAKDRSGKLAELEYPNLLHVRNKILNGEQK